MSKLFEEAIADAKKLKEVAEENAKKAILESVTPQIREFIESQLLEGEESEDSQECKKCGEEIPADAKKCEKCHATLGDGEEDSLEEEIYLDEGALSSLAKLIGEENLDSLNESKSQSALFSAVKGAVASMDDKQREKLLNLSHKLNESADHLSKTKKGESMSRKYYEVDLRSLREAIEMDEEEMDMKESDDMVDDELSELYEEFSSLFEQDEGEELPEEGEDEELPEEDEGAEGGETLTKDEVFNAIQDLMDDLELGGAEMGAEEGMEGEGEEPPEFDLSGMGEVEDEGEALNEVFEVDPRMLRQEINRMKKLVREGKMDHHFGGKGANKVGVNGAFGGNGNKRAGVKGAFGGGHEGKDVFVNPPQINKLNEAVRQLRRQNRAQSEKLNKYRGAVNTLREQLEELNLFNAKLLYVNKLLQNKSLNESQKKSVIKALDEAQSLQEAKTLYKSLTETFSRGDRKTISESRVLGSSSRPTTSAQSKATTSSNELSRWQRLAGL